MPGARRIIAGVSGSPGSVHALRQAAHLAHDHDAVLIPMLAWVPPDGDRHERRHPARSYASSGTTTPGSGSRTPSAPPSAGCPPVSPPSPPCYAASPARYSSARPAIQATCWSSAPGAQARCSGFGAASPATAWLTPAARCWPSRPHPGPGRG
jgi:nucleotide-binding universal stress UspA family protein